MGPSFKASHPSRSSKNKRASFKNSRAKSKHAWKGKSFKGRHQQKVRPSPSLLAAKQLTKVLERTTQSLKEFSSISSPSSPSQPATSLKTALDPWQQRAVEALEKGHHVVVDAPTTAGKTRIVEHFLAAKILKAKTPLFRACYTCPVKSLANDKLKEMRELFGREYVGICTGDLKSQLSAPIVVATLESYRNSLLGLEQSLVTDLVIFDEYHYIQDFSRGSSWQEAMILSPQNTQLLLLSASIANSSSFAEWIGHIHSRQSQHISTIKRPVPLKDMVFEEGFWLLADHLPPLPSTLPPPPDRIPLGRVLKALSKAEGQGLTPAIIYTGRRLSCERLAAALARHKAPLSQEYKRDLKKALTEALEEAHAVDLITAPYFHMISQTAVAYHHSGLPPPLRMAVEWLVKKGWIRLCVATSGLSLGINFSVKSTMIADTTRPGDQGVAPYSSSDVLQMLGRAGRRGKDKVGYSLWLSVRHYKAMAGAKREALHPKLRHDPTTFLGLLDKGWELSTMETLYEKSFTRFHDPHSKPTTLVSSARLKAHLHPSTPLPCHQSSSMHHYSLWKRKKQGLCGPCSQRKSCHLYLRSLKKSQLTKLHHHLHNLQAIDHKEHLTAYGHTAKYLPHTGGLFIASLIEKGWTQSHSIIELAEVIASFSLAYYKSITLPETYAFPLNLKSYRKKVSQFYPRDIFPHLYEIPSRGHQRDYVFIESNPEAGYIIKRWSMDDSWSQLEADMTHNYFAVGDLFSLIYKVASYLQSLGGASLGKLSEEAKELRNHLLRPPLDYLDHIQEV